MAEVGPAGPPRQMGEISCSDVFYLFYIFADFLLSSGEHISGSIATVFCQMTKKSKTRMVQLPATAAIEYLW